MKPAGTWEPPQTIRNFLEKHFNKSLSEGERESIFPKPNVDAVVTPKLGGDAVEQLKSKGKNPHFATEKALYHTQKQLLDVTGPLTCLWADLLNKEAKVAPEDVLLLIQRAQFTRQNLRRPASGRLSSCGIGARVVPKILVCSGGCGLGSSTGRTICPGSLTSLVLCPFDWALHDDIDIFFLFGTC